MKRILHLTLVCLMICLAACSNDEPTPPSVNSIDNAAKHLNGLFSCKSIIAGKDAIDSFNFTPYSEPKTVGTSKVYGSVRYITSAPMEGLGSGSYLYTFTFLYEKLYLNMLNTSGTIVTSYIISDVNSNSFHLRPVDIVDEDAYKVFIRE